jgi:hypothetical protein
VLVEFGARADAEYLEALVWYLERELEVAGRFADEVERVTASIRENPRLWPEVEPGIRRALLRGFPYSLIFALEPDRALCSRSCIKSAIQDTGATENERARASRRGLFRFT